VTLPCRLQQVVAEEDTALDRNATGEKAKVPSSGVVVGVRIETMSGAAAAAAETTSSTGTAGPDDDTKPIEGALAPKKQYPWIAARIDAEYYQAQVQDLAAHAAPSAQAIEGTRAQPRVVTATWRACFLFFWCWPFR
jgi:hypothetical protein